MASASWDSTLPSGSSPISDVSLPGELSSFVLLKSYIHTQQMTGHTKAQAYEKIRLKYHDSLFRYCSVICLKLS